MKIAYIRVSTSGQSLTAQKEKLQKEGCEVFYEEKISGKSKERAELKALLKALRKGDVVCVTKIDRLARSLSDLFEISKEIEQKEAHLHILEQQMDTSTPAGKLLFSVLGALAEFERSLIVERTQEGQKKAKAKGVKFGRKSKTNKAQDRQIIALWKDGSSWSEIAKTFGVSRQSVWTRIKKYKEKEAEEELEKACFGDNDK